MTAERDAKRQELARLQARVAELEADVQAGGDGEPRWRGRGYNAYYATTGFALGIFGAAASLLLNVIGSALIGQHPLQLIKVYLTFPLGEKALSPEFDNNVALAIGCCLYLGTGMLLGILFQLVLAWFTGTGSSESTLAKRLLVATGLAIVVWLVAYYGLLTWLQPALFGGKWIVEQVPWYVAAATHLVFGWTMAVVYPLGTYQPYKLQTEA